MKSEIRNLKSRGFTLLEVILATSLAAVVLMTIGSAINIHLKFLDVGRTQVEEAQLARAVLRRIADDLRGAVQYAPPDIDGLMSTVGELPVELEGMAGDLEEVAGDLDAFGDEETDRTADLSGSAEPPSIPGLYGNAYELQVDTSRLPRIDEYNGILSSDGGAPVWDMPSDVKTVTYYVTGNATGNSIGGTSGIASDLQQCNGLVRRETGRATAAYAAEQGRLDDMSHGLDLLAPEVAAIEFRYCDGMEWLDEWDSVEKGGLPLAVEIVLAIVPAKVRREQADEDSRRVGSLADVTESDQWLIYRMTVHLPAAEPTGDGELSEDADDTESSDESEDESGGEPSSGGATPGSGGAPPGGGAPSSGGTPQLPDRVPDDIGQQLENLRDQLPSPPGGSTR
ncbi:MAG: prepilin-type N-terminal cleavage/methylation domain-containing protein [Candidatus Nealsonbacteria bacterium]|nr:prepilin-type N-terminal cleavage/methylation domain-containing protein [Candidatus Nealsonbacteria bacterium]